MRTITINGTDYKLTAGNQDRLLAWAIRSLRNPLDVLADALRDNPALPPIVKELMTREAFTQLRTKKTLGSPEIQRLVNETEEGVRYQLYLLFADHHPDLTAEQVWELHLAACKEHGDKYLALLT